MERKKYGIEAKKNSKEREKTREMRGNGLWTQGQAYYNVHQIAPFELHEAGIPLRLNHCIQVTGNIEGKEKENEEACINVHQIAPKFEGYISDCQSSHLH